MTSRERAASIAVVNDPNVRARLAEEALDAAKLEGQRLGELKGRIAELESQYDALCARLDEMRTGLIGLKAELRAELEKAQ